MASAPSPPPPPDALLEHAAFVRGLSQALLGDETEADDNVQDTWVAALEHPPRHRKNLRAWLGTIARRLAFRRGRTRARRARREQSAVRRDVLPSPDEIAAHLEVQQKVAAAAADLDEPYRSAIALRYLHGYSPARIAEALGVPLETVRTRLRRGLHQLRGRLDHMHAGDRLKWTLALFPLAHALPIAPGMALGGASITKTVLSGVAVMKARLTILIAALCIVLVGLLVWQFTGTGSDGDGESDRPGTAGTHRAEHDENAPPELVGAPGAERSSAGAGTGTPPGAVTGTGSLSPSSRIVRRPSVRPNTFRPKPYTIGGSSGDPDTGLLRVRLSDENGNPRDGAKLRLHSIVDGLVTVTFDGPFGPGGELEVPSLPPGRASLWVDGGGFRRNVWVEIEAGAVTSVDLPMPRGARVEGVVRHREKGPQASVKITLESRDGAFEDHLFTMTDAEGRYVFEEVPPGRYPVSLTGQVIGHHPRPRDHIVVSGQETITKDFDLGVVTLSGVVRDASTGAPLPGVRVGLQEPFYLSTHTDGDGQYEFLDVPPGSWRLVLVLDGYAFLRGDSGEIVAGECRTADFSMQPATALVLTVLGATGLPLAGEIILSVQPLTEDGGSNVSTNIPVGENGVARYPRVLPGRVRLGVRMEGYERWSREIDAPSGECAVEVRLKREEGAEEEATSPSLFGVVRDAESGRPIPGVRVKTQSPVHKEVVTDAEGVYRFSDLLTAKHLLIVSRDGYGIRFLRDVAVEAGTGTEFDIVLTPAGTLVVEMFDARGDPVVGHVTLVVHSEVEGAGTRVSTGITANADGVATYKRIVPGRYELKFVKEGTGTGVAEAAIDLGETHLRVRLE